ncbi:ABC transporter permease [Puia dinghuensis]|uniref:ABC transporter permease n=1 Tax=Puia dinghuensis TaxID=1792502 RepID=A0A8J2XRF9_9BACT|nr:ABC transporter permease [Puia dinghuensis]GGA88834.1 ABC transporter permease [Puia dinghuensis]
MLKNLLTVALRNFKRDGWYSLLNILGLTIGITFSLFLIFYIKDELSFDRYNQKADRIFRIASNIKEPDKDTMRWVATQVPLAPTLKKDYPEVEEAVRFISEDKKMYKKGELRIYEDKVYYADSNVFRIFTYPFIQGDPRTALVAPNSLVLTQSVATTFFGKGDAVGQALEDAKGDVFKVTGVIKDIPYNSHFRFNVLISATTLPKDFQDNWGGFNIFTYVLVRPHTDAAAFEKKLFPMYDKYMAPIFAKYNIKIHYAVQPILSIHLHSNMQGEPEELGSMSYIYIFSAVAFFMLIIACINYMNLTTARSARRAKEIGVRKVTGSTQPQLIAQFLIESMLAALIALLLSIGLVALLLPVFNSLAGKFISFGALLQPGTLLILLAIVLFVGFLGGSYPALYLSKFDPIHILKGNLSKGSSNVTLRRILVVTQFSIAMIMLICTLVVFRQLNYIRNKDLGFDRAEVLTIPVNTNRDARSQIFAFTNAVRKDPRVLSASTADAVPGQDVSFNLFSIQTSKGYVDQGVFTYAADEHYFKTLGMQIRKGRDFSGPADTLHSIIVNESMVNYFGWDNPIGKRVKIPGDTSGKRYWEVVGVVKDFNQRSLYNPIAPLLLRYRPNAGNIQLKLDARDVQAAITGIQQSWRSIFPDLPFDYTFLDQSLNSQYEADQKRGKIFTAFSVLTVAITCLGLLGLIAFTTQQRQKEISLRKIMGAGVATLVTLITRNFVALVGISCLIAFPVAWLFMDKWLKIFPYNTGLSATPFLLAAVTVLLITFLTVIYHTVRAALANPSKSLRAE